MRKPLPEFAAETEAAETAESETDRTRPYWIPAGVSYETLPEELKAAIVGLVNPAYRALVLKAEEGLQQSTGVTVVHLLWLEILDQIELGTDFNNGVPDPEARREREALIARLLRTVGAKNKTTNLLLRLYEFRQKWGSLTPPPDALRTPKPH